MSENGRETKIARLRQEVEKLSAKHTGTFAQAAVSNGELRELATKRIQILARRKDQLDEMLDGLQRDRSEEPSLNTAGNSNIAVCQSGSNGRLSQTGPKVYRPSKFLPIYSRESPEWESS